jgi:hypothetical protein
VSVRSGLKRLGAVRAESESDFEQCLGPPTAFRTLFTGTRLFEWSSGRCAAQSIVVLFDASQRFVTVAASSNVRVPATAAPRAVRPRDAFAEGRSVALDVFAGV